MEKDKETRRTFPFTAPARAEKRRPPPAARPPLTATADKDEKPPANPIPRGKTARARPLILLLATLLAAALLLGCIDETPPPTLQRSRPAPTAAPAQIAAAKQEYLTALFWSELAAEQAERQPQTFHEVLNWSPDPACVDTEGLQATEPAELPAFAQGLLDCLLADLTRPRPGTTPWRRQTWEQKEKAAAAALERAWQSQSPENYFQYAAAARDGFHIDRKSSPTLGKFARTYDHCRPSPGQARLLSRSSSGERAAELWLQYAESRQGCLARQHEENYPLKHQAQYPGRQ